MMKEDEHIRKNVEKVEKQKQEQLRKEEELRSKIRDEAKEAEERRKREEHKEQEAKNKRQEEQKEKEEERRQEEERIRKKEEDSVRKEEEKIRKEKEEESVRKEEERIRKEKEEERRQEEERIRKEEERIRKEKEESVRKEEERIKKEKEEERRLEEEKIRKEKEEETVRKEEERIRKEEEDSVRKEEERIRKEKEERRQEEERIRKEEERQLEEERIRKEEMKRQEEESDRQEIEQGGKANSKVHENEGQHDKHCTQDEAKLQEETYSEMTPRDRAIQLLRKGGMPLFPAGRREWDKDEIVTLVTLPTSIKWPPKNWKTMKPEQKYFNWEFASMALELKQGIPQQMTKEELLIKYNFLALPGSKMPTMEEGKTMQVKSRFYLYNVLKQTVNYNNIDDSTIQLLNMLETAVKRKDNSLDDLCNQIDSAGVELRLGDEL